MCLFFFGDVVVFDGDVWRRSGFGFSSNCCCGFGLGCCCFVFRYLGSCSLFLAIGHHDHDHVAAVEFRIDLDLGNAVGCFGDLVKNLAAKFWMLHFAAPEHDRDFDSVTFGQELLHLAGFGIEVAYPNFGAVLHFLDLHGRGLLARCFIALFCLIDRFPMVHDLAHRWIRLVGDFYEVKTSLLSAGKGIGKRNNSDLFTVSADKSDLTGTNLVIDSWFGI